MNVRRVSMVLIALVLLIAASTLVYAYFGYTHSNGIFYGNGAPTVKDGANENDLYLDVSNNNVYQLVHVHGSDYDWVLIDTIRGDKGDKGDKGDTGDAGSQGQQGLPGENGKDGIDGTNGTNGIDGINGTVFYTGQYDPSNVRPSLLGKTGDIFLDIDTFNLYQKEEYAWFLMGNIKGAMGSQGEQGIPGKDGVNGTDGTNGVTIGSNVFAVSQEPSSLPYFGAISGDFAINVLTGQTYYLEFSTWILIP